MDYWYQCYDGSVQDLENIKVDLRVLTEVLFRLPRFGGHSPKRVYTVGEHSLLVHDLCSDTNLQAYALLHDAHEAYTGLGDVCTHTKRWLREQMGCDLHALENRVDTAIAEYFGLDPMGFHLRGVKEADRLALLIEVEYLFATETTKPAACWGDLDALDALDSFNLDKSRFYRLASDLLVKK